MKRINLSHIAVIVSSGFLLGISQPLYLSPTTTSDEQAWFGLLALVGYMPLFLAIAKSNLRKTFFLSFFTVTFQLTVVLYWIYIALNVHGHIAPPAASLITLLLPMILAFKAAIFLTIGRYIAQRFSISFFLIAPAALTASEYFRNYYIFGGFPWGNVGYSIGRIDQFLQCASLIGVYGLVFLVLVINALLCAAWVHRGSSSTHRYVFLAVVTVLSAFIYGHMRLQRGRNEFAPTVRVALLQGNIAQEVKSEAGLHYKDILDIYLNLHRQAKAQGADLIVWPESSYPRMLDEKTTTFGFLADEQVATIMGASVYGKNDDEKDYHAHNSAFLVDDHGDVVKRYDKSHLVPFGEYVPWPLSGLVDKIVPGLGAFKPGIEFQPVLLPLKLGKNLLVGTTVCYEGIFPEISRLYAKNGAALLVNLTNDAWYGLSSAPFQHLLMYRIRSVESGLPFVRATNTGITAFIDPYGKITTDLGLFERGFSIANIPLIKKSTVYVAIGDVLALFSIIVMIFFYLAAVLPVHRFILERSVGKMLLLAVFFAIACGAHYYYSADHFLTDESARTKALGISLLCLVLAIGFLAKTAQSRMMLMFFGFVIAAISIALAIFESPLFLLGLILGLLISFIAFRMKKNI